MAVTDAMRYFHKPNAIFLIVSLYVTLSAPPVTVYVNLCYALFVVFSVALSVILCVILCVTLSVTLSPTLSPPCHPLCLLTCPQRELFTTFTVSH